MEINIKQRTISILFIVVLCNFFFKHQFKCKHIFLKGARARGHPVNDPMTQKKKENDIF